MEHIHFVENITALRKKKKVTQEQLADFCGVTKASVSKWETGQSMPDILLLPRLAGFFGVTIDELIGYEAYLTQQQMQRVYEELSAEFTESGFVSAMAKTREYVKQYYSCYEFLEKIVLLWLNYEMFAGEKLPELLQEAKALCVHILSHSRDIRLCNDMIYLKAIIDLQMGDAAAVMEALEDINNPTRLSVQGEEILLSAYIQSGMTDKANEFAQSMMFLHLVSLIGNATKYLQIHKDDLETCEKTLYRIEEIIRIYNFGEINFNIVAVFSYQMAAVYCLHGEKQKAMKQFRKYMEMSIEFLRGNESCLKSDDYFENLEMWYRKSLLGGNFPREKKAVYDSLLLSFGASEFAVLREEEDFIQLQKRVEQMRKVW